MTAQQDVIVIVEDNPDDQLLLARAFRKADVRTPLRYADDGEKAIEVLGQMADQSAEIRPAVVLLDLKLPRRSGLEVLAWIKSHAALRRVPVIILTSSQEAADLQAAYDIGANSYLVKPARPEDLFNMVQQIDADWLRLNEPVGLAAESDPAGAA